MNEKSGQQMKEITKQLEEGIRQLYDSDKYAAWLDVMSKFHSYSFRNCMLIAMQKPMQRMLPDSRNGRALKGM